MINKKVIMSLVIAISFVLLVTSVVFYISKTRDMRRMDPLELESMNREDIISYIYQRQAEENMPFYYFIPIFGFFGVVVGSTIYFILNSDLEKKDKTIKHNAQVMLKLLNPEERKVITKIVENGGKIHQAEITYMEGYTKVKAHRIVEHLVKKEVLTKEALGKMRAIKLNNEIYEFLRKK